MNTAALKAFAPALRRDLIEAVDRKLDLVLAAQTPDYRTTYAPQAAALKALADKNRVGLVERVAYTWFNRLTALRYLDARGWHPFGARVLTAAVDGELQPEILKQARNRALPPELALHTDMARLDGLLDGRIPSTAPQGEVYRHVLLAACRFYHALLPDLFERLDDASELLLPDDMLTEQSVGAGFRTVITDQDCTDVEAIGWLYQFYIAEKKDAVMARKAAVPSADIPAVTQLFTPHWIVRYLVENSLGRLWLLNRPASRLRERMTYYVEMEPETDFLRIGNPEELRILDPAVGSGHMLTYAFDLLYSIYEEEGYAASEIPGLILRHNLYGIDIDPRAAQLAQLALVLKAREHSHRFFQPQHRVQPNVIAFEDVSFKTDELSEYVREFGLGPLFDEPVLKLFGQFENAQTLGSLIQPAFPAEAIRQLRRTIAVQDVGGQLLLSATHLKVLRALGQAEYLTAHYHVAVTNPPYLGGNQLPSLVKAFARETYPNSKADLFAMFIERSFSLARPGGYCAMITMQSWMFLSSYAGMRSDLLAWRRIVALAHMGARGFDSIGGEVVQTAAFVIVNRAGSETTGVYFRLVDGRSEHQKAALLSNAIANANDPVRFTVCGADFSAIPGSPIAYWASAGLRSLFSAMPALRMVAEGRRGVETGDNERFLRAWFEVPISEIGFARSTGEPDRSKKWFPYNKGGGFAKWFGARELVIDWEKDGYNIKNQPYPRGSRMPWRAANSDKYFETGITWGGLTSTHVTFRYSDYGAIFDSNKGAMMFPPADLVFPLLGFLNSPIAAQLLSVLNPTLSTQNDDIGNLPFCERAIGRVADRVRALTASCVELARQSERDNELSWGFRDLPLLRSSAIGASLATRWQLWSSQSDENVLRMQALEIESNRLLISAYGLGEEVSPDVPENEISLSRPDVRGDAEAFLSYAVGCMMGRYSLDKPGLILADSGDTVAHYLAKVGKPAEALTFGPDADGIIPVLDGEWFEDDIIARTREFLRAALGEATLRDNVRWLEESLKRDLRKYFLIDFYNDHLRTYKKRPIYWLVQSPRRGFAVLIYLHRYTRDTLNIVLNRYLREYQAKLRSRIAQLTQALAGATLPARERTAARKEADKLTKVLHECEEWERQALLPLAQQRIELDLDDGVKVNYLKLADVLAPIAGLAVKNED